MERRNILDLDPFGSEMKSVLTQAGQFEMGCRLEKGNKGAPLDLATGKKNMKGHCHIESIFW